MTPRPLRVLHLTAGSDAGGISRYICSLGAAMQRLGHQVAVAGRRGPWQAAFDQAQLQWIDAPLDGGPLALWAASKPLAAWARANAVDVLHVHYRKAALAGRMIQRRLRRGSSSSAPIVAPAPAPMPAPARVPPSLYTLHLSDLPMGFPWRMLSDFGDFAHVASADARQWMIQVARYPDQRISVIPHGIQVERFPLADDAARLAARRQFGLDGSALVAAYVGRLDYPKNVDWLLDVAHRLPQLQLLIRGTGPDEPALRAAIARQSLGSPARARVHLLGEGDPLPVYAAADALLLPSLREGFAYVCAEAMSCGRPVLRTRTAGTSETVVEDVTGRSCPIDRQAFTDAAVAMLSLPPQRLQQMGQAAAEHVRKTLSFDRQVEATIELYRRLAAAGG